MLLSEFIEIYNSIEPDENGCKLWPRGRFNSGYGAVNVGGKQRKANRVALELKLGRPIGKDLCSLHTCDVKGCICFEHLYEGTQAQNTADAVARNRFLRGALHPNTIDPSRLPRGDNHYARTHPEKLARGDRAGARTKPEKMVRGERVNTAKLTAEQVIEIRKLHSSGALNQHELGRKYNVTQANIWRILNRLTWRHVDQ